MGEEEMTGQPPTFGALARRVINARAGGAVERCHGIRHHGSYSNAAHSWGVAMLMLQIWPADFPRLASYCLAHDVPEAWVGDVPAPMMRYANLGPAMHPVERKLCQWLELPYEGDLPPEDHAKLKACDRLEFWLWCREQNRLGNIFAADSQAEIERYFKESPLPAEAAALYASIKHSNCTPEQAGVIKRLCGG